MVGNALALEQQRAQPLRAWRNLPVQRTLDRHAIGPRKGDRGVSGDASCETVSVARGQVLEQPLDSPVRIAQPLLKAQHLFTDHGEAEVPGLDHARVDRTDGNLVDTV